MDLNFAFSNMKGKGVVAKLKQLPTIAKKWVRIKTLHARKILLGKKIVVFYIDEPLLFACTEPVWRLLRQRKEIDTYFAVIGQKLDRTIGIMRDGGVTKKQVLTVPELMEIKFANLFISATPFCSPPAGNQLNVQIFHGLSSKGQDFPDSIMNFDILFLTSSVLKSLYHNVFLRKHPNYSKHILHEVGFPKLDDVFNRKYDREKVLNQLGLDDSKPTVLYAPTWVKDGSLSIHGKEIIRTLLDMDVNLIVKLHPSIYNCDPHNPASFSLVGDTDWEKELSEFEKHKNYRNILDTDSNPYLIVTDILITEDGATAIVDPVVGVVVADALYGLARHRLVVDDRLRRDLAGQHHQTGVAESLGGDARVTILSQDRIQDRVRDLVRDLVGVTLGYGFRGKEIACRHAQLPRFRISGPTGDQPARDVCNAATDAAEPDGVRLSPA